MKYTTEQRTTNSTFYTFEDRNKNGEQLIVELTNCYPDNTSKYSLPNLWKEHGYTTKIFDNYICVSTYATDNKGYCRGYYNPQEKPTADGKRRAINFDWMLEVTKENTEKILKEIYRRFIECIK